MNENIHNDDNLFREAFNNFEEEPSPEVWDKLNSRLDKREAAYYRAKFISWKRVAILLLLLLGSVTTYEIFFSQKAGARGGLATDKIQSKSGADSVSLMSSSPAHGNDNHKNNLLSSSEIATSSPSKQESDHLVNSAGNNEVSGTVEKTANNNSVLPDPGKNDKKNLSESELSNHSNKKRTEPENNDVATERKTPPNVLNAKDLKQDSRFADEQVKEQKTSAFSNQSSSADSNNLAINNVDDNALALQPKPDSAAGKFISQSKKTTVKLNRLFKPYWSFSPYIAADITGQQLADNDDPPNSNAQAERNAIVERENDNLSYSAGLLARYQINRKLSLKSGLVYSNLYISILPQTLYASHDNNNQSIVYKYVTSSGYAYVNPSFNQTQAPGDSIESAIAKQYVRYISIPLMASYTINAGRKLSILPGAGFTTDILLQSITETELANDTEKKEITIRKLQGLDRVYFSFIADVDMRYQINNKLSLMLLPSFKYAVKPTTSNLVIKTYPYSLSFGLGIAVQL